jgi:hypothetical protein
MSCVHYQFHGHTARLIQFIIKGTGRKSLNTFKLVCHPGDSGEQVMTIMLPEEDESCRGAGQNPVTYPKLLWKYCHLWHKSGTVGTNLAQ